MIRVDPIPGETRLQYMTRVLVAYMAEYGDDRIIYDAALCDGQCIADDFQSAVDQVPDVDLDELKKAINYFDAGGGNDGNARSEYLIKAARKLVK
jgi:hypothetical protein